MKISATCSAENFAARVFATCSGLAPARLGNSQARNAAELQERPNEGNDLAVDDGRVEGEPVDQRTFEAGKSARTRITT